MELPNNVYQILVGSLLGDGSIAPNSKSRRCCNYSESHSIDQLAYLEWKVGFYSKFFGGRIYHVPPSWGKQKVIYSSSTRPLLTKLREIWYPNGKKAIPQQELEKVNSLGLAVWYQDDGGYNYYGKSCSIILYCYKGQETLVKDWFTRMWGIRTSLANSSEGYKIVFSTKEADKLLKLISPFACPCLHYKFGPIFESNREKLDESHRKFREQQNRYRRHRWHTDSAYRESQLEYTHRYRAQHQERLNACRRSRNKQVKATRSRTVALCETAKGSRTLPTRWVV